MKKTFILVAILLFQVVAFGQVAKGISAGFTPFGRLGIKSFSDKTNILSSNYSITSPAFHLGYEWYYYSIELLYAKEHFTFNVNDSTGVYNYNYSSPHHFGLHGYRSFTILPARRVQIPISIGIGLSYFTEAIPAKLFFDVGGRIRLKVYVTNRIALYGGGYYFFGFTGNKTSKYLATRYGVDAGLLFNF
jgi:hypothetical protein